MANLNNDWLNAFRGAFETEEDVIEFIFDNLNTNEWEDSYINCGGCHEPNEQFRQTVADKKELLYDFMIELVNKTN